MLWMPSFVMADTILSLARVDPILEEEKYFLYMLFSFSNLPEQMSGQPLAVARKI